MQINKNSLKARANNLSNKLGISQNIVYNRFFFDAFLARLSISPYKDKFVLKGGLYLSSVLGIDTRSTMDMDFYIKHLSMEKENIVRLITDIAIIDINDGVTFKVVGSSDIRLDDQYGGFQVKVISTEIKRNIVKALIEFNFKDEEITKLAKKYKIEL